MFIKVIENAGVEEYISTHFVIWKRVLSVSEEIQMKWEWETTNDTVKQEVESRMNVNWIEKWETSVKEACESAWSKKEWMGWEECKCEGIFRKWMVKSSRTK